MLTTLMTVLLVRMAKARAGTAKGEGEDVKVVGAAVETVSSVNG